jgi:hypothetical protein
MNKGTDYSLWGSRKFNGIRWTLERFARPNRTGYTVLTAEESPAYPNGRVDHPVLYHTGEIGYDTATVPQAVQDWVHTEVHKRLLTPFHMHVGGVKHGGREHGGVVHGGGKRRRW